MAYLSAATIASWEAEAGQCPIHGVGIALACGAKIEPHLHNRGQIMVASAGVVSVTVLGRVYVISGQRGVWVPEGVPHEAAASTAAHLNNLQITRAIAPRLPQHPCMIAVRPLFKELVGRAVDGEKWISKGSREEKILDLLVTEFETIDVPAFDIPQPRDARLQKICSRLREDPSDARSLGEWATMAGGCTRTLERLFRKETGLTFAQWRRQLRLHEAVVKLQEGQPVTTVALESGYDNTSAFIEMFRRVTGKTPGRYLNG